MGEREKPGVFKFDWWGEPSSPRYDDASVVSVAAGGSVAFEESACVEAAVTVTEAGGTAAEVGTRGATP